MKQKNNWYVFSGVASSGKTTIIKELEKRGHKVVHESATDFIKQQFNKGLTIEQVRRDENRFQTIILQLKLLYEGVLDPRDTVFIDRGTPDAVAFYKLYNLTMNNEMQKEIKNASYKKVFLFERLPLIKEDYRAEPEEEIAQMDKYNKQAYEELGHTLVHVPVMPVDERLNFILKNL